VNCEGYLPSGLREGPFLLSPWTSTSNSTCIGFASHLRIIGIAFRIWIRSISSGLGELLGVSISSGAADLAYTSATFINDFPSQYYNCYYHRIHVEANPTVEILQEEGSNLGVGNDSRHTSSLPKVGESAKQVHQEKLNTSFATG
jgi:hypothetical protein